MKDANGKWIGLGVGDVDPEVARVKAFLRRKFSYAAHLDDTPVFGVGLATVIEEAQRRYQMPVTGIWDYALKLKSGYLGPVSPPPPAKPVLYTFAGTWSHWDAGFQADAARALLDTYTWQPCAYPASFGFINPPFPGAPAYVQSVEHGVNEGIRLITLNPGKFALSGYSQGGEVVGRLCQEVVGGRLAHRRGDLLGVATFGDPARQPSDRTVGDGTGAGISRLVIPDAGTLNRLTAAVKGDMYATIPDGQVGDQMHAAYIALTRMGDGRIDGAGPLLAELLRLAKDPITGGMAVIDAVVRAAQVSAHGTYGPLVPAIVDHLRNGARR